MQPCGSVVVLCSPLTPHPAVVVVVLVTMLVESVCAGGGVFLWLLVLWGIVLC